MSPDDSATQVSHGIWTISRGADSTRNSTPAINDSCTRSIRDMKTTYCFCAHTHEICEILLLTENLQHRYGCRVKIFTLAASFSTAYYDRCDTTAVSRLKSWVCARYTLSFIGLVGVIAITYKVVTIVRAFIVDKKQVS